MERKEINFGKECRGIKMEKEKTEVKSNAGFLEKTLWGISYRNWSRIVGKLIVLYVFLGLYFTALLHIGFEVRGTKYMSLPSKYFGKFDKSASHPMIDLHGKTFEVNRPEGCEVDFSGMIICDGAKNPVWNPYPWWTISGGLNKYAKCFEDDMVTSIHHAYKDGMSTQVCGSSLPNSEFT